MEDDALAGNTDYRCIELNTYQFTIVSVFPYNGNRAIIFWTCSLMHVLIICRHSSANRPSWAGLKIRPSALQMPSRLANAKLKYHVKYNVDLQLHSRPCMGQLKFAGEYPPDWRLAWSEDCYSRIGRLFVAWSVPWWGPWWPDCWNRH